MKPSGQALVHCMTVPRVMGMGLRDLLHVQVRSLAESVEAIGLGSWRLRGTMIKPFEALAAVIEGTWRQEFDQELSLYPLPQASATLLASAGREPLPMRVPAIPALWPMTECCEGAGPQVCGLYGQDQYLWSLVVPGSGQSSQGPGRLPTPSH